MNREDIVKALEICTDGDGSECEKCPLAVVPGCTNKLIREARDYILSMLQPVTKGENKPDPWTRKRVLKEAEKCVCGQREQDYGTPEDSFNIIADLWAVYLKGCGASIDFLESHDVAIMMALLKIARLSTNPQHMDSWCDLAGYASCGGEIAWKEENK